MCKIRRNQHGGVGCIANVILHPEHRDRPTGCTQETQERARETERQRDKETKRQRDKETKRQRDKETRRQSDKCQSDKETKKQCVSSLNSKTDRKKG